MSFISTADPQGKRYSLAEVVRLGPAPDGGLFMPARIPRLPATTLAKLGEMSRLDLAMAVLEPLLGDELDPTSLRSLLSEAFDFPVPLVELDGPPGRKLAILELFHGPTLAFKDVGARFLARLLPRLGNPERASTVLVATSGDTGGAVAQAFYGVAGTRVVVLYPQGKVSAVQERQFSTLGGNVTTFAVGGTFDDCQHLVKAAFADRELAERLQLTSANSINLGRLLPQMVYYFWAASQLAQIEGQASREWIFTTPSGNFGNLTAGLMAKAMGLPCRFVAATNLNDVVPAYLESGQFIPRASVATLSNAMDVGAPNNFPRILHLYNHDLEALRRDVRGERVDDAQTHAAIREVAADQGYILDPHTAVGWVACQRILRQSPEGSIGVVLGTAHPAKFAEAVVPAVGAALEMPAELARHLDSPVLSHPLAVDFQELRHRLLELAH